MSVRIHNILTGELESSYATSVFGAPERHPAIKKEALLPYGYKERRIKNDGTVDPGLMVPVPIWYIEGEDAKILIDTGLGDCDEIMRLQYQYGIDYLARKSREQEIVAGLATKGLKPEDIDIVVLQKSEIPMLISPPRFATFYYREWSNKITDIASRLIPIEGDFVLSKATKLVRVGGHSPGQMAVFVHTDKGRVCIASDFLYNYSNLRHEWPIGPVWNMEEWISGLRFIQGEADIILPNHDFEFYQIYPDGIVG